MRILIAGIGNIFYGDDAFGVEVVHELMKRPQPEGVEVKDFGIRGYDLAYALTDGYDLVVLVDAAPRGHNPGVVYLLEPDPPSPGKTGEAAPDAHALDPVSILRMARSFGVPAKKLYLVGCEPAVLESEDGELGLSPSVRAAVPKAVDLIEGLVREYKMTTAGLAPA